MLEEMLDEILADGASIQQQLSGAPNQQLPVEDIFNFARKQHDRCCVTRIGVIEARRRISKAPSIGTNAGIPCPHTISGPPQWYPDWLRDLLRERARTTIREDWPSQDERAESRWQKTCELAQVADARSVVREESTERTERTIMTQLGGYIGPSSAGQRLAPLQCLTLEQYDEVDWNADSRANGWTNAAIINQFRLRNANKGQRTESEAVLLKRKGVIKKDDADLPLTPGGKENLIKRLKLVLEAETAAVAKDRAHRQVERDLEARAAQAEQGRERQGRRGRGNNATGRHTH